MHSKTFFIRKLIETSGVGEPCILELGCGTARHVVPILKENTNLSYIGVEPFLPSFNRAQELLGNFPNVRLYNQQGYTNVPDLELGSCDIVFSLSTLEHVKQLDVFIKLASQYARPGGLVVHRYDLGHALHSKSLKEKFQVWIGNTFPQLLPEDKFVRYVPEVEVRGLLAETDCEAFQTTYHEMLGQKTLAQAAEKSEGVHRALRSLMEWEYTHAHAFTDIPLKARERLFPAVAVWSRKRN